MKAALTAADILVELLQRSRFSEVRDCCLPALFRLRLSATKSHFRVVVHDQRRQRPATEPRHTQSVCHQARSHVGLYA